MPTAQVLQLASFGPFNLLQSKRGSIVAQTSANFISFQRVRQKHLGVVSVGTSSNMALPYMTAPKCLPPFLLSVFVKAPQSLSLSKGRWGAFKIPSPSRRQCLTRYQPFQNDTFLQAHRTSGWNCFNLFKLPICWETARNLSNSITWWTCDSFRLLLDNFIWKGQIKIKGLLVSFGYCLCGSPMVDGTYFG